MLFWGQWWNFTFKTSIKVCSNLEKKQQILQKRLVKVFFWKRKMQISQQLWKHFDKSSNKQLKIWIKTFEKEGLNRFFSLKVSFEGIESCSRTVVYLFSRKSEVFTQVSKSLRNLIFFKKSSDVTYSHAERCFDNNGESWSEKANNFHVIIANFYVF